jgi:cobalt/nickel transport system permease protein
VVNVILALFGHGGITVIGLNTLTLSVEGILAYFFFRLFWRGLKRLSLAAFLATFLPSFFHSQMVDRSGTSVRVDPGEKERGFSVQTSEGEEEHPQEPEKTGKRA